jgi:hypothetical protein
MLLLFPVRLFRTMPEICEVYCLAYGDYIRRGLDCQLDLLDPNTVHSVTAYTHCNSQQLSH